jgi:hypothetical protein
MGKNNPRFFKIRAFAKLADKARISSYWPLSMPPCMMSSLMIY